MKVGSKVELTAHAKKFPGIGVRRDNGKPLRGHDPLYPDAIDAVGTVEKVNGVHIHVIWPSGHDEWLHIDWLEPTEGATLTPETRQIERMAALLRDVKRSGGADCWSHLHSHGHLYATVRSAVSRGYLRDTLAYHYELTDDAAAFFVWYDLWEKVSN